MRIAIDGSTAIRQLGGISEYTYQLLVAFGELAPPHDFYIGTISWDERLFAMLPTLPENFHPHPIRWPYQLAQFGWRTVGMPKITWALPEHDLFFAPHFLMPPGNFKKLVVTIHDVLFLDHPQWFLPADVERFRSEVFRAAAQADHLITVSEASKKTLLNHKVAPAKKIRVIPNGIRLEQPNHAAVTRARSVYKLPEKYLIFVGTIEPRKNILRLLDAYAAARKQGVEMPLVMVGRRGWLGAEFEAKLAEHGLENAVRVLGSLPREDRDALLKGAQAMVFPSLAEGFGLPVLEAMAAEIPVITSNVSSLPEVAHGAALLIDPTDTQSLANALLRVLDDSKLRTRLIKAGKERAKQFTWQSSAQQTLELFEKVG